jgi:putative Holliday junction resolvase
MRIMGLDVGVKRIGIAFSDPLEVIAGGHMVMERQNLQEDLAFLDDLCKKEDVKLIVIGLPRNMNGSLGPKALEIKSFAASLEEHTGVEVRFWDERLSTVAAEKVLLEADLSRAKRKKVIDKVAAVTILQNYLDSKK